jgi:hypothetical protein
VKKTPVSRHANERQREREGKDEREGEHERQPEGDQLNSARTAC